MPNETRYKRAVSFIDGQNLFRHAKDAFGHHHPNYDPGKLAAAVCEANGWFNEGIRFYTGIPTALESPFWHGYWTRRATAMTRAGTTVTMRTLRGGREKGIDLRLGLDVVRMARNRELNVAVIFSQDQDLAEVADEIRDIARAQRTWLKIVSAFPHGPNATSLRGINGTDWFCMGRAFYNACLDPRDYRPQR